MDSIGQPIVCTSAFHGRMPFVPRFLRWNNILVIDIWLSNHIQALFHESSSRSTDRAEKHEPVHKHFQIGRLAWGGPSFENKKSVENYALRSCIPCQTHHLHVFDNEWRIAWFRRRRYMAPQHYLVWFYVRACATRKKCWSIYLGYVDETSQCFVCTPTKLIFLFFICNNQKEIFPLLGSRHNNSPEASLTRRARTMVLLSRCPF